MSVVYVANISLLLLYRLLFVMFNDVGFTYFGFIGIKMSRA